MVTGDATNTATTTTDDDDDEKNSSAALAGPQENLTKRSNEDAPAERCARSRSDAPAEPVQQGGAIPE